MLDTMPETTQPKEMKSEENLKEGVEEGKGPL